MAVNGYDERPALCQIVDLVVVTCPKEYPGRAVADEQHAQLLRCADGPQPALARSALELLEIQTRGFGRLRVLVDCLHHALAVARRQFHQRGHELLIQKITGLHRTYLLLVHQNHQGIAIPGPLRRHQPSIPRHSLRTTRRRRGLHDFDPIDPPPRVSFAAGDRGERLVLNLPRFAGVQTIPTWVDHAMAGRTSHD